MDQKTPNYLFKHMLLFKLVFSLQMLIYTFDHIRVKMSLSALWSFFEAAFLVICLQCATEKLTLGQLGQWVPRCSLNIILFMHQVADLIILEISSPAFKCNLILVTFWYFLRKCIKNYKIFGSFMAQIRLKSLK